MKMDLPSADKKTLNTKVCRVCVVNTNGENIMSLDDPTFSELFDYSMGITINPEDSPRVLCSKCADIIKIFAKFKEKCHQAHILWQNCSKDKDTNLQTKQLTEIEGSENHSALFVPENINPLDVEIKSEGECDEFNVDIKYDDVPVDYIENEIFQPEQDFKHLVVKKSKRIKHKVKRKKKKIKLEMKERKKFRCDKCQKGYVNEQSLNTHITMNCGKVYMKRPKRLEPPSMCGLCEWESPEWELMKAHLEEHRTSGVTGCGMCDFVGADFASLLTHRHSHLPEQYNTHMSYVCPSCDVWRYSQWTLQFHYRSVHMGLRGGLCHYCGKSYHIFKHWRSHERLHYTYNYMCDMCGKKFIRKSVLRMHIHDHLPARSFVCHECGKCFKRPGNLKLHIDTVHVTEAPIKCTHCNKMYKCQKNLDKHMRMVTREKNFICPVCAKPFFSEKELKNHSIWHEDARPFVCDICGSGFKIKGQLKVHMRIHSGVRPFACGTCGKCFGTGTALRRHGAAHGAARAHACSACRRTFHTRKLLHDHAATCHGKYKGQ